MKYNLYKERCVSGQLSRVINFGVDICKIPHTSSVTLIQTLKDSTYQSLNNFHWHCVLVALYSCYNGLELIE